jgi:CrcB protein
MAVVAAGGAIGSLLRWAAVVHGPADTVQTVVVLNLIGSAAVGILLGRREQLHAQVFSALSVGVAGGLTTFSAYAVDVARSLDEGRLLAASAQGLGTPVAAVLAAGLGYRVARWSAARRVPTGADPTGQHAGSGDGPGQADGPKGVSPARADRWRP